eukprot:CAMPEP_0171773532 /NCGR_PEP_ID=MMETSP0991-20121206/55347_1 /TAXON_ID=483369 /ORGANISM="non described non described, Strain CCMP2098" /LENGTH=171 /DNA_ID=CAMNT_0012379283 /DNA_START=123 /DNA_END=639 /DNA_ORIENTATION=+
MSSVEAFGELEEVGALREAPGAAVVQEAYFRPRGVAKHRLQAVRLPQLCACRCAVRDAVLERLARLPTATVATTTAAAAAARHSRLHDLGRISSGGVVDWVVVWEQPRGQVGVSFSVLRHGDKHHGVGLARHGEHGGLLLVVEHRGGTRVVAFTVVGLLPRQRLRQLLPVH